MASVPAPLPETANPVVPSPTSSLTESHAILSRELRRLTRVATIVAVLASPSVFYWFHHHNGWASESRSSSPSSSAWRSAGSWTSSIRKVIPWPSLFGTDDTRLREEDIVNRRRAWTWRLYLRVAKLVLPDHLVPVRDQVAQGRRPRQRHLVGHRRQHPPHDRAARLEPGLLDADRRRRLPLPRELPDLHGPAAPDGHLADPRLRAGRRRVGRQARPRPRPGRGEGGDAPRRHALAVGRGVRGLGRQARARAALPRRTGHRQDDAGEGDRDRLQLAVRLHPGLRLRATFIGIDAIIVRFLARKAKKLARKWGGQCIVFIDEIDAVGMRRQALGGAAAG